jgi:diguanylate cyclase (GGDEF)-like protein
MLNLRQANSIIAVCAAVASVFPIIIESDFRKAGIYLIVAFVGFILAMYTNYSMQKADISNKFIYTLIVLFFSNVMIFGIYLSVWTSPNNFAAIFLSFLICSLLIFVCSPLFNFFLTLSAIILFSVSTIMIKEPGIWVIDIVNVLVSGMISLYFSWQVAKFRLGLELSTSRLEEERNKYVDQSITDELTQLRNRRDYMQTFQRFVSNYRASDDYLCVAIADIDFFKGYNDYYGHPKGDDCLRAVGGALNSLKENMGVYVARVGGEEFSMLWFEKDVARINTIIGQFTKVISDLKITHEKSKVSEYVTMSIGVHVERCGSSRDVQTLYDAADKLLYTAKASGRNCAIVSGSDIKEYKITPSAT